MANRSRRVRVAARFAAARALMFSVTNIAAAWSRSSVGVRGDSSHVRARVHEASLFVFVLRQG
eukprot:5004059-Alexandrium_andersonii.AAC.1